MSRIYGRSRDIVRAAPGLVIVFGLAGCAPTPGHTSQTEPIAPINTAQGVALKGYDPVAYFATGKPVQGSDAFTYSWHDVAWHFASAEDRDAFVRAPEHYAPQFGGYCAFAISRGLIADIDPSAWAVVGDKLYLNNNAFAQTLWDRDRPGNITAGEANWPLVPKLPAPSVASR